MNIKYIFIFVIAGSLFALPAFAAEKTVVSLSTDDLQDGLTAEVEDESFSVRFSSGVIDRPGSISLSRLSESEFPDKPNATRVGDYFHYNINVDNVGILERPLFVTTSFDGNPYNLVRLHYYDKRLEEWVPLPSRVNLEERTVVATSHFPSVTLAAFEESALRIDLAQDILERGYTIDSPDGNFALGFPSGVLATDARVVIKRFDVLDDEQNFPEGMRMVSPAMYEFALRSDEALTLNGQVNVRLNFESDSNASRSIYYLDKGSNEWRRLPSRMHMDGKVVTAQVPFTYAPLIVLEEQANFEGTMSWYRGNTATDAATNLFPLGTAVRVTNRDTGAFTDVEIVSTWAGTSRHIIDLTFSAFSAIANPWEGIARVRVERL